MSVLDEIIERVRSRDKDANTGLIERAHALAMRIYGGQKRKRGGSVMSHVADVAFILSDFNMDEVTISVAFLHAVQECSPESLELIKDELGEEIEQILNNLEKLNKVSYTAKREEQAEYFRRLILSMARDVRVVMVKLADHLVNMREMADAPKDMRFSAGQETLDIYAPLANRLGINRMKSELEDIGFAFTQPDIFTEIENKVDTRLAEQKADIEEVQSILGGVLDENRIKGEIKGRKKHILSIYNKMLAQDISFEEVYDLIAFRIIVNTLRDCYAMLGAIHGRWKPVPGRFKDYVALPKSNMYQSLHTTVIGPMGQPMEIQIRTHEMNRIAEEGIAAHWRYKEKRSDVRPEDSVFQWLRKIVEANEDAGTAREFLERVKGDLFPDVVYVFTPAGDLKEMPRGSTPVDFAYEIHTRVGECCVGAKVNDRMVPLSHVLSDGDRVEITTQKEPKPSADWLDFVKTTKAKSRIRHWIKTEQRKRSISLGKEICEREFRKVGKSFSKALKAGELDAICRKFGMNKGEELLEAVGYGKTAARQVLEKVYPEFERKEEEETKRVRKPKKSKKGIVIDGVGDTMVRFAKCCNPIPMEPVLGFVTRGHGMAVHTTDCPNVGMLDSDRIVEVEWGKGEAAEHPVRIRVSCDDKKGILANITNALTQNDVNIASAEVRTSVVGSAECSFVIMVKDLEGLQKILGAIQGLKGVRNVTRVKT